MVRDEKNRSLNPITNEIGSRSNSPAAPTPTHLLRAQRQLQLPAGTDPILRPEQAQERGAETDVLGLWVRLPIMSSYILAI